MKINPIIIALGLASIIFGTIILYVKQFPLFSSIVNRTVLYYQAGIIALVLFGLLLYVLFKVDMGLKALEKAKISLSGIFVCIVLSPLILILINKISVKCDVHQAVAVEVRQSITQRFGFLEDKENKKPDFMDVYFINEDGQRLKIRKHSPFTPIEKQQRFSYEKCRGLTNLQWMKLPE